MRVHASSGRHRSVLILLLAACHPPRTAPVTAEQEVRQAEQEWVNVTLKQDADSFASFLDDKWVGLGSRGGWIRKEPWTASIRSRQTHYDTVTLSNLEVRFPRPDVAVVTGEFMQKGMSGTRDNSAVGRYINTWTRIGGRWQLVSSGFAPRPSGADTVRYAAASAVHGMALTLASATHLKLCSAPGLSVDLRLDSAVAPGTPIAMGTAELAAGGFNAGTHNTTDEAVYFLTDGGRAFGGSDTVSVSSGLMLWVPRGVRHGFWSAPQSAMRFVWTNVPQDLAQRFRSIGVPPNASCPGTK